jgi:hypothetical protein
MAAKLNRQSVKYLGMVFFQDRETPRLQPI